MVWRLSNVIPTSVNSKTVPLWMADAQHRFENVFITANEKSIVELWLKFEELLGYPDDRKTRLTKEMRPWNKAPPVDKASEFGATWMATST
jgi:hypothetical protein